MSDLKIVVLLNSPDDVQREYRDGIRAVAENLDVTVINDVDRIDPYLASMDVLMTFGPFLRGRLGEILRKAPRLRWIQGLGSGVDGLLSEDGAGDGIVVTRIRGVHDAAVSEAAIAAMLALSRNLPRAVRNQDRKIWDRQPSRLLEGKTVGLLGVGLIASALARRCKAFDMRVAGISTRTDRPEHFDEMRPRENLEDAVRDLDYLVVLAPYSRETHHLVGERTLSAMKPASYLINVARGGVVDEAALIRALEAGRIAGAALDVFAEEPLPADHPFWRMPNVIVTPHTAGMNVDYVRKALPAIHHNIKAFRDGDLVDMIHLVRLPGSITGHKPATARNPP